VCYTGSGVYPYIHRLRRRQMRHGHFCPLAGVSAHGDHRGTWVLTTYRGRYPAMRRPGVEHTISRSRVRRANHALHYTTEPPMAGRSRVKTGPGKPLLRSPITTSFHMRRDRDAKGVERKETWEGVIPSPSD